MPTPYIGEIIMFAGNFAPVGWALCQGQLMPISDYDALYELLGTTYGGDGDTTFALPDLRGRLPVGQGHGPGLSNYVIGQQLGVEAVTLTAAQLPPHSHPVAAVNGPGGANVPAGNVLLSVLGGQAGSGQFQVAAYAPAADQTHLNVSTIGLAGGSQPHENRQAYLSINYLIALEGLFPSAR